MLSWRAMTLIEAGPMARSNITCCIKTIRRCLHASQAYFQFHIDDTMMQFDKSFPFFTRYTTSSMPKRLFIIQHNISPAMRNSIDIDQRSLWTCVRIRFVSVSIRGWFIPTANTVKVFLALWIRQAVHFLSEEKPYIKFPHCLTNIFSC